MELLPHITYFLIAESEGLELPLSAQGRGSGFYFLFSDRTGVLRLDSNYKGRSPGPGPKVWVSIINLKLNQQPSTET
jgi:hypothetical protein